MTLGWLVVLRSPDRRRVGELIQIGGGVVLSRAGRIPGGEQVVAFDDDWMSVNHAQVTGPKSRFEVDGAFTVSERTSPPSRNGLVINGRRRSPTEQIELFDSDEIELGSTLLKFRSLGCG